MRDDHGVAAGVSRGERCEAERVRRRPGDENAVLVPLIGHALRGVDPGAQSGGQARVDVLRDGRRDEGRFSEIVETAAHARRPAAELCDVEAIPGDGEVHHVAPRVRAGLNVGDAGVHRAVVEQADRLPGCRHAAEGGEGAADQHLAIRLHCQGVDVSRGFCQGERWVQGSAGQQALHVADVGAARVAGGVEASVRQRAQGDDAPGHDPINDRAVGVLRQRGVHGAVGVQADELRVIEVGGGADVHAVEFTAHPKSAVGHECQGRDLRAGDHRRGAEGGIQRAVAVETDEKVARRVAAVVGEGAAHVNLLRGRVLHEGGDTGAGGRRGRNEGAVEGAVGMVAREVFRGRAGIPASRGEGSACEHLTIRQRQQDIHRAVGNAAVRAEAQRIARVGRQPVGCGAARRGVVGARGVAARSPQARAVGSEDHAVHGRGAVGDGYARVERRIDRARGLRDHRQDDPLTGRRAGGSGDHGMIGCRTGLQRAARVGGRRGAGNRVAVAEPLPCERTRAVGIGREGERLPHQSRAARRLRGDQWRDVHRRGGGQVQFVESRSRREVGRRPVPDGEKRLHAARQARFRIELP